MCYVFHVNIFASLTPIWTAGFIFPGSKNPCFGRVCIHPLRNCQRFETQVSPALYKVRKTPLGLLPWAELRMSNKIWETLSKNGWIRLLSHPGEASLLSLTERKMLAWISFCFSEGTSPRDTGVAENNCWARAFPTSVWAKYCLPRSHSFASPISLFLTGGNGCLRHGSNSRSLSCNGCQTRKGTPSPTECIQDPRESALCYMILSPCPKLPTPREMPLHGLTFFIHIPRTDWALWHLLPGATAQHAYAQLEMIPFFPAPCHCFEIQRIPMDMKRDVSNCGFWSQMCWCQDKCPSFMGKHRRKSLSN